MSLTIEHLTQPISAEKPAGEDGRRLGAGILRTIDDLHTEIENAAQKGGEPDWHRLKQDSEAILINVSKNLDAAFVWSVASVQLEGLRGLEAGTRLIHQLLSRFWMTLHPTMENGDPYERSNVLAELSLVRPAFAGPRRILLRLSVWPLLDGGNGGGGFTIGDALMADSPRNWPLNPSTTTLQEIHDMCSQLPPEDLQRHVVTVDSILTSLASIRSTFGSHAPNAKVPDLKATEDVVQTLRSILELRKNESATDHGPAVQSNGLASDRNTALSAMSQIQSFLRSHEPGSPLLPLLDIAQEVKGLSFQDALKRVPPSALDDLKKIFGTGESSAEVLEQASSETQAPSQIHRRSDVETNLQAIDEILSRNDPSTPVLAIVKLCRASFSRSYTETCTRFSGRGEDDILEIIKPKKESPRSS